MTEPTLRDAINSLEHRALESLYGHSNIAHLLSASEKLSLQAQVIATFRRMGHWEFAAAFVTVTYGLFLLLPMETFSIVIGLDIKANMFLRAAAEALWGIAFLIAGLNQWVGAWINWVHWRIANALVMAVIWGGIAYLYLAPFPGSTAGFLAAVILWCSTCALTTLVKSLLDR